jgi:hypothetical protein
LGGLPYLGADFHIRQRRSGPNPAGCRRRSARLLRALVGADHRCLGDLCRCGRAAPCNCWRGAKIVGFSCGEDEGCRPGADRSLTFAARIQAIPSGGWLRRSRNRSRNPTRPKNPSRERQRAVSIALVTLPLFLRIPRANIAAPSEAVAWRVGLACGRKPTLTPRPRISLSALRAERFVGQRGLAENRGGGRCGREILRLTAQDDGVFKSC